MPERDKKLGAQWDTIYIRLAAAVAKRGTCSRAQVGAVLVHQGRPLSVGYNGAPPGMPHCEHTQEDGPCTTAVHAELNAIAYAARAGLKTEGSTLYCTHEPCIPCGQAIVSAGIARVVFVFKYRAPFDFNALEIPVLQFYPWILGEPLYGPPL